MAAVIDARAQHAQPHRLIGGDRGIGGQHDRVGCQFARPIRRQRARSSQQMRRRVANGQEPRRRLKAGQRGQRLRFVRSQGRCLRQHRGAEQRGRGIHQGCQVGRGVGDGQAETVQREMRQGPQGDEIVDRDHGGGVHQDGGRQGGGGAAETGQMRGIVDDRQRVTGEREARQHMQSLGIHGRNRGIAGQRDGDGGQYTGAIGGQHQVFRRIGHAHAVGADGECGHADQQTRIARRHCPDRAMGDECDGCRQRRAGGKGCDQRGWGIDNRNVVSTQAQMRQAGERGQVGGRDRNIRRQGRRQHLPRREQRRSGLRAREGGG